VAIASNFTVMPVNIYSDKNLNLLYSQCTIEL